MAKQVSQQQYDSIMSKYNAQMEKYNEKRSQLQQLQNEFKNDETFKDLINEVTYVDWGQGKWFGTCDYCSTKYTQYFHQNHTTYIEMSSSSVRNYDARGKAMYGPVFKLNCDGSNMIMCSRCIKKHIHQHDKVYSAHTGSTYYKRKRTVDWSRLPDKPQKPQIVVQVARNIQNTNVNVKVNRENRNNVRNDKEKTGENATFIYYKQGNCKFSFNKKTTKWFKGFPDKNDNTKTFWKEINYTP